MNDDTTADSATSGIPAEAQIAAGKLEDALAIWSQRDPAHHHPDVRRAGDAACMRCDDLVAAFHRLRWRLTRQIGAYDQAVTRSGG